MVQLIHEVFYLMSDTWTHEENLTNFSDNSECSRVIHDVKFHGGWWSKWNETSCSDTWHIAAPQPHAERIRLPSPFVKTERNPLLRRYDSWHALQLWKIISIYPSGGAVSVLLSLDLNLGGAVRVGGWRWMTAEQSPAGVWCVWVALCTWHWAESSFHLWWGWSAKVTDMQGKKLRELKACYFLMNI